ncbi:MAG: DUF4296 domain-containing protein [Alistipes sp.]|jgi:hypothetical protein|nr:DUF4296 domain-containing protein [Alistipes sp.]
MKASKIIALLATLLVAACSGRAKVIPDDVLVNIFHDAFLANAYMNEANINQDSILLYEPIFKRYGYTMNDLQHTLTTINERKSSRISDIMHDVNDRLERESKMEQRKMVVLDTIDNLAKRTYTRTMYSDTLIRVKELRDTNKLRITLKDLVEGEYTVSFDYLIDTLDENRNSRVEAYLIVNDTTHTLRHTMMLSRYREGKYSRKFKADTQHKELYVNMYYHPNSEESKLPDITIRNFKIVRVLPTEVSVDSLYHEQLNLSIINHELMTAFTRDTVKIVEPKDTTLIESEQYEEKDSIALRTN